MLPDAQVIYFYCKYNDPRKSNFNDLVRCLIAQILALNTACLQYLYDNMISCVHRHGNSTNTLCAELLEKLALHHEQLFIGVDGLDECPCSERRQILSMIHSILKASKATKNVRIFLASRKEKDIRISLGSASRLEIRPHHLEKDIRNYIRVRVSQLSSKFDIPVEQQRPIIADIVRQPRGLLLRALYQFEN